VNPITKTKTSLTELAKRAYIEKKRLAAPLMGFPGCDLLDISLKLAQQNYELHYNCIEALTKRYKPDMALMMMDLSVEANALGLPVRFPMYESSSVEQHPVENIDQLEPLREINILRDARIQSYIKTIEMMSMGLPSQTLVGAYVIGPFSLVGLLKGAQNAVLDAMLEPEKLHEFCRFAAERIIEYSRALVNAGADVICILEPTGSILGPSQFKEFSADYVAHIMESYKYSGVDTIYHICGNTTHLIEPMANSGVGALSLDSPDTGLDLVKIAETLSEDVTLIGNINPVEVMKEGTAELVRQTTTELLEKMRPYPNFILSTACDLPPQTPLENIDVMMGTARNFQ
jgi:uroporphyrinogen decarboxylase